MGKKAEKRSIDKPDGRNPIPGSKDWTHVDPKGQARMVNIGTKKITRREAIAGGTVRVKTETLKRIEDNSIKKGDVLSVAKVSAIMAAKRTYDLIPMCHPLQITGVELSFTLGQGTSPGGYCSSCSGHGSNRGGNGGLNGCSRRRFDHL